MGAGRIVFMSCDAAELMSLILFTTFGSEFKASGPGTKGSSREGTVVPRSSQLFSSASTLRRMNSASALREDDISGCDLFKLLNDLLYSKDLREIGHV